MPVVGVNDRHRRQKARLPCDTPAGCRARCLLPPTSYGLALDNWSIRRLSCWLGADVPALSAEKLTEIALHTGMANLVALADRPGPPNRRGWHRNYHAKRAARKRGRPGALRPGAARMSSNLPDEPPVQGA